MNKKSAEDVSDQLTRRQWLLKLGEFTVLAGFSGAAAEVAIALPGAEGSATLPPGLYYPSQEHLSHALVELGSMRAIPAGSETEYVERSAPPFRPRFFSDQEFAIVTRVVERLLGNVNQASASETAWWIDLYISCVSGVREAALGLDPLHRALAVAYYGESAVREVEIDNAPTIVRSGLAAMQRMAIQQYGHEFLDLDDTEQTALLSATSAADLESESRKVFEIIRTQAIRGYYTSAAGLRELAYKGNWYYTTCPGCEEKT